jgi:hypothetical protein
MTYETVCERLRGRATAFDSMRNQRRQYYHHIETEDIK